MSRRAIGGALALGVWPVVRGPGNLATVRAHQPLLEGPARLGSKSRSTTILSIMKRHASQSTFCGGFCAGIIFAIFSMISATVYLIISTAPAPVEAFQYADVLYGSEKSDVTAIMVKRAEEIANEIIQQHGQVGQLGIPSDPIDVVISGGGFRGQYAGERTGF